MNLVSGQRYLAAVCLLPLLAACSEHGSGGGSGGVVPPGGGPSIITSIDADSAVLVTQSSLDMIGKMVVIGNLTNKMVEYGAGLLIGAGGTPVNIPDCASSGYGPSTNQISYQVTDPGFNFPPGPRLDVGLVDCAMDGVPFDGMLYITGVTRSGNPAGSGDWSVSAVVVLGPIDIGNGNGNGTKMTVTDKFVYTANKVSGVLTTTLAMAADAGAGQIGGLNAEHFYDTSDPTLVVDYQLRPFYIVLVDDSNSGEYSVAVPASNPVPPEGDSLLDRYTTNPSGEIKLRVATTPGAPILWQGGQPTDLADTPASGEIRFTEADCSTCGSIIATVQSGGVSLAINDGSSVTTQSRTWSSLFNAPDYNSSTP
jgi:hypothetical protein